MRTLSVLIVAAGLVLSLPPVVRADFGVEYPDGAQAVAISLDLGYNLVALLNAAGTDPDIYTIHLDGASRPVPVHLNGDLPDGFAWWLKFVRFNRFGRGVYDVYVDQGGGFFFVGTVAL
jgi:hypothetical protein